MFTFNLRASIIGIVVGSVSAVGGISILMGRFVYRERRRRLGQVSKFTNLESRGGGGGEENGDVTRMANTNMSPSPTSQRRPSADLPALPIPSPRHPRVITDLRTVRVQSPMLASPEFIDYRDRGNEPSSLVQRRSPQWLMVTRPALNVGPVPGSVEDNREISGSLRLSTDQHELDIDELLDLATMYSLSPNDDPNNDNHTTKPFTAATMSSRDRAPSDVPIGAEHMSFYPSGLGSQMYTTSRMQNASVEGSGRPVSSVDSFVREPQRSAETSPTFNPIEITTGTRAETAVARAALMDSQDEMSKVKRIPNDVFASV
jgi:hypothetical protein